MQRAAMPERRVTSGRRSTSRRRPPHQQQQQTAINNTMPKHMPAAGALKTKTEGSRQPSANDNTAIVSDLPVTTTISHPTRLEQRQLKQQRMQPVPSLYTLGRLSCIATPGAMPQQTCLHQLKSETEAQKQDTREPDEGPSGHNIHTFTQQDSGNTSDITGVVQRRKTSAIVQAVLNIQQQQHQVAPRVRPVYDQVTSRHVLLDMLRRRQRRHSENDSTTNTTTPPWLTGSEKSTKTQVVQHTPSMSVYTELKPRPMGLSMTIVNAGPEPAGQANSSSTNDSNDTAPAVPPITQATIQSATLLTAATTACDAVRNEAQEHSDEDDDVAAIATSVHETLGHLIVPDKEDRLHEVSSHRSDREEAMYNVRVDVHEADRVPENEASGEDEDEVGSVHDVADVYSNNANEEEVDIDEEVDYASDAVGLVPVLLPHKPQGRYFVFNLLTTWGDPHEIGLCGIEMYDERGVRLLPLRTVTQTNESQNARLRSSHTNDAAELHTSATSPTMIAVASSSSSAAMLHATMRASTTHGNQATTTNTSVNATEQEVTLEGSIVTLTYAPQEWCVHMFAEYTAPPDEIHALGERDGRRKVAHDGRRQLRSVIDGQCNTHDENHMLALPYSPGQHHLLCFIFARPVTLSMIRVYNYCGKGRVHTSKGVRVMEVTMDDDTVIFRGEVRQHSGDLLRESDLSEMDSAAIASAGLANCENILFTDEPAVLERIMQETMHDIAPDVTITNEEDEEEETHTAHEYTGTSTGMTDSSSHLTAVPHTVTTTTTMNNTSVQHHMLHENTCRRVGSAGDNVRPMWASLTNATNNKPASSCSSSSAMMTGALTTPAAAARRQAGVTVLLSLGPQERDMQMMTGIRCGSAHARLPRRHSAETAAATAAAAISSTGNTLVRPASAVCVSQAGSNNNSTIVTHGLVPLPPRYPRSRQETDSTRKVTTNTNTTTSAGAWANPTPLSSSSSSSSSGVGEIHNVGDQTSNTPAPRSEVPQTTSTRVALYPTRCPRQVRSVCFMFLATWGDTRQVGLSGLRLRDAQGELIEVDIAHWAVYYPSSKPEESSARNTPSERFGVEAPAALLEAQMPCLFDEQAETTCLLPFQPAMLLVLIFRSPITTLGFLEVANYCAGDRTFCGVKEVRLFFSTTSVSEKDTSAALQTNTNETYSEQHATDSVDDDIHEAAASVYTHLWHVAQHQSSRQRLRRAGVFEVTPAQGVSLRKAPAGLLRPRFQTYDLSLAAPELAIHRGDAWGCTSDEDEDEEEDSSPFAIAVGPGTGGMAGGDGDLLGHGGAFVATTTFAHSLSASMNIRATMAMKRARMTLHERPAWLEEYQPYVTPLLPVGYVCKVKLFLCARTLVTPNKSANVNEVDELRRACGVAQETLKAYMKEWVLQPYESCGFINESGQRVRPVHPSALSQPKTREANTVSPTHNNNDDDDEDDDANVVPMVAESIISTCGVSSATASAALSSTPGGTSAAAQAALLRAPLQVMLELVYVADVPFCLAVLCLNKSLVLQDRCAAWVRRVQVHMDDALIYDSGEAALEAVQAQSNERSVYGNSDAAARGSWFAPESAAAATAATVTYRTSIKPYVILTLDAKTLEQVHDAIGQAESSSSVDAFATK